MSQNGKESQGSFLDLRQIPIASPVAVTSTVSVFSDRVRFSVAEQQLAGAPLEEETTSPLLASGDLVRPKLDNNLVER